MSSLNRVWLMGHLTRDPELRHTTKGTAVAEMCVATNRRVPDGAGGWTDETTFVDFTAWAKTAESCAKYLAKGRPVFVEGRLQLESWEDKQTGQKRSKLKVVAENVQFLGSGKGERPESAPAPASSQRKPNGALQDGVSIADYDTDGDEVPF